MSALRVARGFTRRNLVVKLEGCYHGHSDCLLAKAGSGALTFGLPDSAGVPESVTRDTLTLPFNDLEAARALFGARGAEIAALILEPVAGNMGVVPPAPGYLEGLRELTARHGSLLVFDEVMTGFRLARGGAQERYGIVPDLTCMGKIVGGGLPLAAYGGRREIMETVAPVGPVYQAGTLSGNPVAVAAGLETLKQIELQPELYAQLEQAGSFLEEELNRSIARHRAPAVVQRVGSMITLFFSPDKVTDYATARRCNTDLFARYFQTMLAEGVYLAPSQFEAFFLGAAHSRSDLERTARAADRALGDLLKG